MNNPTDPLKRGNEHPIPPHPMTLRQLADCVLAALEVMRKHDVTLAPDGYTVNWGSSQNSMAALAFTHYYETEAPAWFQDEVKLRSTFTGEGPYDVPYMLFNTTPEEFIISRIILLHYPLAFNEEVFLKKIEQLMEAAYSNKESKIREYVQDMVNTYHPA